MAWMKYKVTAFATVLVAAVFLAEQGQCGSPRFERTIVAPEPLANGSFGYALDRFDGRLLVGASYSDRAYLVDFAAGETLRTFTSPEPDVALSFGRNLVQWGDSIVVSDFDADYDPEKSRAGAMYLFDQEGNHEGTLRNPGHDDPNDHNFGLANAVIGDRLFVASYGAGAIYGYDQGDDAPDVVLRHPDYEYGADYYRLLPYEDSLLGASWASGVVHQFDPATGVVERTFSSPDPDDDALFGSSIELTEHGLLVAALQRASGPGKLYLFDPLDGTLLRTFVEPNPQSQLSHFGRSVAVIGDRAFVSAPYYWKGDIWGAGAVFEFDLQTGEFIGEFFSPNPGYNHAFGSGDDGSKGGLMAFEDRLLVSAPNDNVSDVSAAGAIYVYTVPEPNAGAILLVCLAIVGPGLYRQTRNTADSRRR